MPTSVKQMTFTTTIASPSALANAAAGLAAGENIVLATSWVGTDIPTDQTWNWNNKWFIDEPNALGYGATKRQNAPDSMVHFVYDMNNNIFRSVNCGFSRTGHVYDCIAYDYSLGRGYLVPGGGTGDDALWYTDLVPGSNPALPQAISEAAYSSIPSILYASSQAFVSNSSAMDFHPNLFGTGDGGHVIVTQKGIAARRKSTGAYSILFSQSSQIGSNPCCVYSRGVDACIVQLGLGGNVYRVSSNTNVTLITSCPLDLGPDHSGTSVAALVDSPFGDSTMYAIEKVASGRVWKLTGGNTWSLQTYTHDFSASVTGPSMDFQVAAYYGHNCIVAIERTGTFGRLRLWRPNS